MAIEMSACEFDAIAWTEDDFPICDVCGSYMVWEDCGECDDGLVDLYDEDPLWYEEDEFEECSTCHGNTGWWMCPRADEHPQLIAIPL